MAKKTKPPTSHPDDLMVVSVCLTFQAKLNPDNDDPAPFDATELEQAFDVQGAGEYLERLIVAIRERRLYGFFQQELAQDAVNTRQWVAKTTQEVLAEGQPALAAVRLPNLKKITWRAKD
jgi:hypothetical protein